jgi:predicted aldo/keto reductase-like oxidoreductase
MQLRRVGRTPVQLSVVGFGTCQLRLVPEGQAVAALRRGFELGVNWVHVSPDYGGADELVLRAMRESGVRVLALSDGSGEMVHFERCFEQACRLNGPGPLPLWGISCIDDQEFVGHNVWGRAGMVEFLEEQKRAGRLLASYCTTHAPPEYVADLVTSGCFDALMLAWNPLGFHVLSSYAAAEGKRYEDLAQTRERIFPLARERGVSLLVMKALAGGLLGKSRAFPPRALLAPEREELCASDVLRHVLAQEGVTAVVPGTASVEEAEQNARAGHAGLELGPEREARLAERIAALRRTLCSRCGECESTCSRGLPIAWLFREAYIWLNPGDTFDAAARLHYFHLHPESALACASCTDQSCLCPPQGLDIPAELARVHAPMLELRARGELPRTPAELEAPALGSEPAVRILQSELPRTLAPGARARARLWLENAGQRPWPNRGPEEERTFLEVLHGERTLARIPLREEVHPGARGHFVFELEGRDPGLRLVLRTGADRATELCTIAGSVR